MNVAKAKEGMKDLKIPSALVGAGISVWSSPVFLDSKLRQIMRPSSSRIQQESYIPLTI
jgi:hypothetical protein